MDNKQIVFVKPYVAELLDAECTEVKGTLIKVRTYFSTVSCGTEKANLIGKEDVSINGGVATYPRSLGYSSAGVVEEIGDKVTSVKVGDRVAMYWTTHSKYNVIDESQAVKIIDDKISFEEAAILHIVNFPMAAVRKTRLEMGESALVMGLGILGQLAVKLLKVGGAVPIVAADPIKERREEALKNGADFAFDPYDKDFAKKVKDVTCGGANVCIEVTGIGAGLDGALDCMAKFGRVALLGCTRNSDFSIDYYKKVHGPGITLIGAHTLARPENESYPAYWTHRSDMNASMKLILGGRLDVKSMIKETYSPLECTSVYERLVNDKNFPTVVQFDWRNI